MPSRRLPKRWAPIPVRPLPAPLTEADARLRDKEVAAVRSAVQAVPVSDTGNPVKDHTSRLQEMARLVPMAMALRFEESQMAFVTETRSRFGVVVGASMEPLFENALDRADAERVVWTPLLDAMALGPWPQATQRPDIRLRRLGPWIAKQATDETLMPLREFRSVPFCRALAAYFPGTLVDENWMEWALRESDRQVAVELWNNPGLSSAQREAMADVAIGLLIMPPTSVGASNMESFLVTLVLDNGRRALTGAQLVRLTGAARTSAAQVYRSAATGGPMTDVVLLRNPTTPEDVLLEGVTRRGQNATHWTMAAHPNAPIECLRLIAETGGAHLWSHLAQNPRAMADPVIRSALKRSTAAPIMRAVLETASAVEFPAMFARFLAKQPVEALDMVLEGLLPPGTDLAILSLPRLLAHKDQAVRMKAFLVAHKVGALTDNPSLSVPDWRRI